VPSRKDTGRVDAKVILHTSDKLFEEVPIPYPVVDRTSIGRRTISRVRLVACCTAAGSLDIHSDGVRVHARIVESSLALDGLRISAVAMETKDDWRCFVDVVVLRDMYQVGSWNAV
jgi:hypothetical protein